MKITIDARLYGLENAGLGRYVMNLIDELTKIDSKNKYILLLRKKYFVSLSFPANFQKVLADYHHYTFKEQIFLPFLLYRYWPDVVHFPHFNVPLLYLRKYIVTLHDLIMHKFEKEETTTLPKLLYIIKRIGYKIVFSLVVRRAYKIIVPSQFVKNDVYKNYSDINIGKIICTYEGFTDKYSPNNISDYTLTKYKVKKPYIVYYGNVYPHKNLNILLEAIKEANDKDIRINLFLSTPKNVFAEKLFSLIRKYKLNDYVTFPGFVEDDELSVILKSSLSFVYPSLLEGFGLQGIEAMGSGTLLLASDIEVFREIYKDKAIYFDPLNKLSLIAAIKKVLNMEEKERDEWVRQGLLLAKSYSWAKMAKETLSVYEESSNSL